MTTQSNVPVSNIPTSIDYLSRDFTSIRSDLISVIQNRLPNWAATDPADFGLALVEAFAYVGDVISYYIDRSANESSILTATQRQSILNISQIYGYQTSGYRPAYTDVTFTNSSGSDITIPGGTVVSGQVSVSGSVETVYFSTIADVTVPAGSSANSSVSSGQTVDLVSSYAIANYGELIGTSDGTPNQSFAFLQSPVVDGSTTIYIQDGDVYSQWTQVTHLTDYGPNDLVYTLSTDENNLVSVNFGDGVAGSIPVTYSEVRAMYSVGGGSITNVNPGVLTTITYVPGLSDSQTTALQSSVTVTNNSNAFGGDDPETNDSIRQGAPATLRAGNRAITTTDFSDLALTVTNCGKANAVAETWTSVTLYVSPVRQPGTIDIQPGLDNNGSETTEFTTLQSNISTFLADKTLIGTNLTIQPPVYVDLVLGISYVLYPSAVDSTAQTNILNTLLSAFNYVGMNFGDTIYPSDVSQLIVNNVPEVRTATVGTFYRASISATSVTGSGTAMTYTTSTNHGLSVGSVVTITGFSTSGYNVTNATVTAVGGLKSFTVAGTTTSATTGTGTVTGYGTQQGAPYEIFRLQQSNITL